MANPRISTPEVIAVLKEVFGEKMNPFLRLYYRLTAFIPRLLPRTELEFSHLKQILIHAFDLPDNPKVWATVAGHVSSTPTHKIRQTLSYLANVGRRLTVNAAAEIERAKAMQELKARLEVLLKEQAQQLEAEENEKKKNECATSVSTELGGVTVKFNGVPASGAEAPATIPQSDGGQGDSNHGPGPGKN